jgi:DNA-binding HxlR family transcriptional regulator
MLGKDYANQTCSIARTLEIVGERWTLLILRDIFLRIRRFDELQEDLGIARNVLAARLDRLIDEGILEKVAYQQRPPRYEYMLTERGIDLWPIVVELLHWGDRHAPAPGGEPIILRHKDCGGQVDDHRICDRCGARRTARDVAVEPGPGADENHPLMRRRAAAQAAA